MTRVLGDDDPAVRRLPLGLGRDLPTEPSELGPRWQASLGPELRFPRCDACGWYLHPPVPACPRCGSRSSTPTSVSGRGVVHSCTVNHQRWDPDLPVPYAIAIVELADQPGLRLTTNVVDVEPGEVRIGLEVQVAFVAVADLYVPVFEPAPGLRRDG